MIGSTSLNAGNSTDGIFCCVIFLYFGTGANGTANQVQRIAVVLEKTGITSGSLTALRPDNPTSGNILQADWDVSTYQ